MIEITLPADPAEIGKLEVGDRVLLRGTIFTGRDAALPKLVGALKNGESPIDVQGAAIMHTAVSPAGIAPTSSNKEDIEESIPYLASAGVLVHIGKGKLGDDTIRALGEAGAVFIVTPPVAALLTSRVKSRRVAAFEEEGMEAIFELRVEGIPGIVAAASGRSIYSDE
ncbi:fumarate hydratase C-terminal domain-containing protein [Methanothermobacter wolfeii]|uniref:fumarate hydratase C-terminal domain-containing protein n=1 Tax=Methanothermobacter wolfeii TaxID=145261 RepID=UPI0024B37E30|nr:fumarate hydratase C-terminal domain-containing protein [Methanothermobacter wolfeii]MDI6702087.1 fumarate hydratase C-terminal domain-containing protein [Methanothermobacter wolfeii]MDI6842380.1 fumarate hydratase C-terminal domain-containing protein [Methanothermobacter wolfeii]